MPPVRRPRRWGLAYLVAFNTLTAASNPMRYGLPAFLNYAAAWVLATIFALLAFRLILPRDPARELARLRATVRDEALALLRGGHARPEAWQQRQQHRVAQLGALLKSRPALLSEALAQSLAAMHLGREVLRIRRALRRRELPDGAQHVAMQGLERLARQPGPPSRAAVHAKRTARLLERHADAASRCARRCRRSWPRSPTSMRWRAGMPRTSTPNHHGSPRHVERVRRGRHLRAALVRLRRRRRAGLLAGARAAARSGLSRRVWHPALFEIAVSAALASALLLYV